MSNKNFGYGDNYSAVSNRTQSSQSSHQNFPTSNATTAPTTDFREQMLAKSIPVVITTSMDSIDSLARQARTTCTTGTSIAAGLEPAQIARAESNR